MAGDAPQLYDGFPINSYTQPLPFIKLAQTNRPTTT